MYTAGPIYYIQYVPRNSVITKSTKASKYIIIPGAYATHHLYCPGARHSDCPPLLLCFSAHYSFYDILFTRETKHVFFVFSHGQKTPETPHVACVFLQLVSECTWFWLKWNRCTFVLKICSRKMPGVYHAQLVEMMSFHKNDRSQSCRLF